MTDVLARPHRHLATRSTILVFIALGALAVLEGARANSSTTKPSPGETAIGYRSATVTISDTNVPFQVPTGCDLAIMNDDIGAPRLLTFGPGGALFAGTFAQKIYRLAPPYNAAAEFVALNAFPHGVAFRENEILIARSNGVYRAPFKSGDDALDAGAVELLAALPGRVEDFDHRSDHLSRTVRVGPDGRIYASLGHRGNCGDQFLDDSYAFDDRRGGIVVLDESANDPKWLVFASGLRNPVGFDWHPSTGDMYATNNGPDHIGFHLPPEHLSRVEDGSFHGMPWRLFDGDRFRSDADYARAAHVAEGTCSDIGNLPESAGSPVRPSATFPSHSAPMDLAFVGEGDLDPRFVGDAVVALHGSWATAQGDNKGDPATRRQPKLVAVRFHEGVPLRVDDLVTGFQAVNGRRWARPVGLAFAPDGALFFSSDEGAVQGIFRLSCSADSRR